jgi:hypothetical protein
LFAARRLALFIQTGSPLFKVSRATLALVQAIEVDEKHEGQTDKVQFSIDHGKEWESISLGQKIRPLFLVSTPD